MPPVVQAVGFGGLGDGQVAHPGFHPRQAPPGIQFEDAVELGQAEQKAVFVGQGTSGQPGAGTPGHHRYTQTGAQAQDVLDLGHALG